MLIAAFALLAAAQAGNPDLQCILDRVPAAVRSALADESVQEAPTSRPAGDVVVAAANACREQRGWDPEETGRVGVLAFASIMGEQSRARLGRAGIDPRLVVAWFDARSPEARVDPQITDAVSDELIAHLVAAGTSRNLIDAQADNIGALAASLMMIERVGRGLPLD
jgi:hypothetical protein